MDKMAEYNNPTKNIEAIPEPITEGVVKSCISSKNINTSVSTKRVKKEKNKTVEARGRKTQKASLPAKKTPAMFPFSAQEVKEMIMNSIMSIGKHDGASFADISKHMEENYKANMELLDAYVNNFLKNGVENGFFERIQGTAGDERFKIKLAEGVKENTQNLLSKEEMVAQIKKQKKASDREIKNLKGKATVHPIEGPEIHCRDQATESTSMSESLETIPGPSKGTEAPNESIICDEPIKNSANARSKKRTRSAEKGDTESKKLKIANPKKAKIVSANESKNLKRKTSSDPKTSKMIMDAIRHLKKRNGVSLKEIMKHMEENHVTGTKVLRSQINKFLNKSVEIGTLEKLGRAGAEERYKIKKLKTVKRDSRNVRQKAEKAKSVRKKASPKKSPKTRRA